MPFPLLRYENSAKIPKKKKKIPLQDDFYFIETEFLKFWLTHGKPMDRPIEHKKFFCEHGKLDPNKVGNFKRISPYAWNILQKFPHDVALHSKSEFYPCVDCVFKLAQSNFLFFLSKKNLKKNFFQVFMWKINEKKKEKILLNY